ncbi:MAG TPA: hypothetical protein VK640_16075 [Actinomycetes bacterium]|nr:hypothetical protein [Actinomycetes bacterium]
MFVQVIKGKVSDRAAVQAHMDRWQNELSAGAQGWLGTTAGVAADGTMVAVVRFEDEAAARRNSDRSEQGAWWAEMAKLIEGDATFQDSDRVMVDVRGNPEDARFVQVMQGGSTDPERAWKLMEEDDTDWSAFRPDIIGSINIGHPDGRWTMVNYFTSEAEARAGEQKQPTPEMQQMMDELTSLADGPPTFIDITEPIYSSPK